MRSGPDDNADDLHAGDWSAANQRHLMAAVAEVRQAIEHHGRGGPPAGPGDDPGGDPAAFVLSSSSLSPPPAVEALVALFHLSAFERAVLLMAAGYELDAGFAAACAAGHGDPSRPYPTFGLALAAFPAAHWSAVTPDAPLRHWRLVELVGPPSVTRAQLRIDERVLHHLTGTPNADDRLAAVTEPVSIPPGRLVASHAAVVNRIVRGWSQGAADPTVPLVQLTGPDPDQKRAVAAAACAAARLGVVALSADAIPLAAADLDGLARLCERESALARQAVLVEAEGLADGGADAARWAAVARFLARTRSPVLLSTRDRRSVPHRPSLVVQVGRPTRDEQRAVWADALGPAAVDVEAVADELVAQFDLTATDVRAAAAAALAETEDDAAHLRPAVWAACRATTRGRAEAMADRIDTRAGWDDLVLPAPQRQALADILVHVRHRTTVYDRWGMAPTGGRGQGVTALFSGVSGTGKTLAAEVLAAALGVDLYRIDLSAVVSKYIGETEKNLRRVFDAAEGTGALLLFDEADALFGKRSDVKDSHDRYANVEVSYLLQRMEAYRGLAVLTTNARSALDPAFLRRLSFAVPFPFPEAAERERIWRRAFPPQTPTDGLDPAKLARLSVAGGHIRNIAVAAAFAAAADGGSVRMSHVLRAARAEFVKLERPLAASEVSGWA